MDISETTTSQESAAEFSPERERENFISSINRNNSTGTISKRSNDSNSSKVDVSTTKSSNDNICKSITTTLTTTTTAQTKTSTNTTTLQQQNEYIDKYLENCTNSKTSSNSDIEGNSENLNVLLSTKNGLTPVKSHPLMAMGISGSDSESESSRKKVEYFSNYPDVVPESEPLRLGGNPHVNHECEQEDIFISTKNSKLNKNTTMDFVNDFDNLNINNNISLKTKKKINIFRDMESPDLQSSAESDDLSQYQATVEPLYQTVALQHSSSRCQLSPQPPPVVSQRKKIPLSQDLLADNLSDTISNHSLDLDDDNPYLASLSPSSSIFDDTAFREIQTPTTPATPTIDPLPQYSASDEARDSRNWQKITLPDGKTREIDMKVIDPYKRVLSHGGYLKSGGHNAIVVFSACHLPDRSRADYHYVMNNLFLYVVKTLEQLVTEDYVLVYLHGGSNRGNVPPFPWLKK